MLDQRHRRAPRHGDLRDPGGRRECEAEQNAARDRGRVASGPGPTPAAGLMISTVSVIRSALRCAMLAFAAARAARRRPFSAMLAGRSRSWRAFKRAVTPAIPAVAPTAIASARPSRLKSPFAATLEAARAPAAAARPLTRALRPPAPPHPSGGGWGGARAGGGCSGGAGA